MQFFNKLQFILGFHIGCADGNKLVVLLYNCENVTIIKWFIWNKTMEMLNTFIFPILSFNTTEQILGQKSKKLHYWTILLQNYLLLTNAYATTWTEWLQANITVPFIDNYIKRCHIPVFILMLPHCFLLFINWLQSCIKHMSLGGCLPLSWLLVWWNEETKQNVRTNLITHL